ncbi:MAG: hypothetical protein ACYTG6_00050 [Planctomycetota bacterium]|jgi:hypothetical protein
MVPRDRDLEEVEHNIRAFEEAMEAGAIHLPDVTCRRILAAADGSNQTDALGHVLVDLLRALPEAGSVGVLGLDAETVLARVPEGRGGHHVRAPRPLRSADGHLAILESAREAHADLVLLPAPFMADYGDLGGTSLGVVVDVLLGRMHLPLLTVRDPARAGTGERTVLFVEDTDAASLRAAAWALRLSHGPLSVVVAASRAERERWEHLAGRRFALDDDAVREALDLGTSPLVAAVHRAARDAEREARVRVAVEPLEQVLSEKNEVSGLHVVPQGPLCRPVLLGSTNPALAVP